MLLIAYRTKTNGSPYSAGGLAANALHTVEALRAMGVAVELAPVKDFADLCEAIHASVTRVVVEALWLSESQITFLSSFYPNVEFVLRAHSKIGFLQVEPEAVTLMRWIIRHPASNVRFSTNNAEFARSLQEVYGPVLYLPNLYDMRPAPFYPFEDPRILRIASFGATRLLKMHPSAALAALQIAGRLDRKLAFYVNVDKTPGGDSVRRTIKNLLVGVAELHEVEWQDTDTFRQTIAGMDLVLQLSATETFCLVAADAVVSGVPVVVGPAIEWVPERYQARIDDTSEVAEKGVRALLTRDKTAGKQAKALACFQEKARDVWRAYLGHEKKRRWFERKS